MRFAHDIWLYAVPLLPLGWLGMRAADRRARSRLAVLLGGRGEDHLEGANPRLRAWRRFLLFGTLFWLLLALARPQWGASEVAVTQRGSDIVVALDISNSMLAEDVPPNRLERAKSELTAFLRRLRDSRIGLVFFAGGAFVQCPLTLDYGTTEIFLDMAAPDMLSEQGTAIASALETSRSLLARGREGGPDGTFQAILLVTDGEDLEGKWEQEADRCRDEGIRLIPVGVGEESGGLIPVTDRQGRPAGFMKDDEGNVVMTRLDLASLERMADYGGGSPFRIGEDGLAGDRLFADLERMGKRDLEERRISAYQERFHWPLLLAAISLLARALVGPRRRAGEGTVPASLVVLLVVLGSGDAVAGLRPPGGDELAAGREAYLEGNYEQALDDFASGVVAAPDDPLISLAMGETLFRLERYEEAGREFTRTLGLTDEAELRAEALYNAGTTLLAAGDAEGASGLLLDALALDPDQVDALENLEIALRQMQQPEQEQEQEQQQEDQEQDQDAENDEQQPPQDEPQDQQEQQEQQEQEQQQQDQEQQEQEQQEQEQQQQPEEQELQPPEEQSAEPPPEDELTEEQALQLLQALDRDEEELKKSVQRRLQGARSGSGKRW